MAIADHRRGNGKSGERQWWENLPIPESWYLADERSRMNNGRDRGRERDRDLDLDDTRSSYRRRYDDGPPPSPLPHSQPRVVLPLAVFITIAIYLLTNLVGSIWWAATQQSKLDHEIVDRQREEARLWDGIQTYRTEVGALRIEIARLTGNNRRQKEEE